MARSDTSICNSALMKLGAATIISLDDDTKNAKLCKGLFGDVRDAVLRAHPWNCAVHRATLAQLEEKPAFGYSYQYALPTNPYCLRVLGMEDPEYEYRVEGRVLLTDLATARIIYIKRVTDANEFDSLLVEAISARLAADLAFAITGSATTWKGMWDLYILKLTEARSADGQEGTPETLEADEWIRSRL